MSHNTLQHDRSYADRTSFRQFSLHLATPNLVQTCPCARRYTFQEFGVNLNG